MGRRRNRREDGPNMSKVTRKKVKKPDKNKEGAKSLGVKKDAI